MSEKKLEKLKSKYARRREKFYRLCDESRALMDELHVKHCRALAVHAEMTQLDRQIKAIENESK